MSVRQEKMQANETPGQQLETAAAETQLSEGNNFSIASPENPLERRVVVSIRSSLNDLCLQKQRGTWAPSTEALRNICAPTNQRHFPKPHNQSVR